MVTQPAYITNLKSYARLRNTSYDDLAFSVDNLSVESDRGAIILAATVVEDELESRILSKLPGLRSDEPARKRMFEQDGLLSSFSQKTKMAYAIGIIDKATKKQIDLIREIRNACAHSRQPISLETKVLRVACKMVLFDTVNDLKDHSPETLRRAFALRCMFIAHYIVTGQKIESADDQIRFWRDSQRKP